MNYQISSDNIDLSESNTFLAREKIGKLERFFSHLPQDAVMARVVINKGAEEDTFEVRLDINADGKTYFTKEVNYSLETALIQVVDEIERQLEKDRSQKEKEWEKRREMKVKDPLEEE